MSDIVNLKPEAVWRFFDEITRIPRPSKKEEKIVAYLIDFAKSRSLEYRKDSTGNVVIRKGASPGMETALWSFCRAMWIWFARRGAT